MALSLAQAQAIADLAGLLYDFLPGNPHPYADPRLSFRGIAGEMGLFDYWPSGSKGPAITALLSATLERRVPQFCPLVVEAVRRGIAHRHSKAPVTREEIEAINNALGRAGFKIPDLHDRKFLDALPSKAAPAAARPAAAPPPADPKAVAALQRGLRALLSMGNPQERGTAFEVFLNGLFAAFDLEPRDAFHITGGQIDGSFQFHGDTYLLEAKWQGPKVGAADLHVLSAKLGASWARGFFISWSGFTDEGLEAFSRRKRADVLCMEGLELVQVLDNSLDLRRVIELKARASAETNAAFVPVRRLFANVI